MALDAADRWPSPCSGRPGRAGGSRPERESRLLRRLISAWAVRSSLETARATTRSDAAMFVGQPTIWADAPTRPPRLLTAI